MRNPDFTNLLKVLKCEKPERPTLFEFFLNDRLYKRLVSEDIYSMKDKLAGMLLKMQVMIMLQH